MTVITTNSEEETIEYGINLAKKFKGGEIIGLVGNLGAGKTILTKGIAQGLGIKKIINSPTFVIMKVYEIKNKTSKIKNLIHIDAYRLQSHEDLVAIGVEEYLEKNDTITIIEWADKVKKILPKKTKFINININKNSRKIKQDCQ